MTEGYSAAAIAESLSGARISRPGRPAPSGSGRAAAIKAIQLEQGFERNQEFDEGLGETIRDLARLLGAEKISWPKAWKMLLRRSRVKASRVLRHERRRGFPGWLPRASLD